MNAQLGQRIVIGETRGFKQVEVESISHILCEDYLCTLYLINKAEPIVCSKSLNHFGQVLPPASFVRIHHNAIVNLRCVREVHCVGRQRQAIMADGMALPVSVRRWPAFRDALRAHTLAAQTDTLAGQTDTPTR